MADKIVNPNVLIEKVNNQDASQNAKKVDEAISGQFEDLLAESPILEVANNQKNYSSDQLTLGEKILQGMQELKDHVESGRQKVEEVLSPPKENEVMDMQQMFKAQMAITNLMVTEDYIGKIVSKSTQTFDTLLRNQ